MDHLNGSINGIGKISGTLTGRSVISGTLSSGGGGSSPPFEGEYEYTPTEDTQTIAIQGKRATQDIVINPIPSNYGLITWNGTTITVS